MKGREGTAHRYGNHSGTDDSQGASAGVLLVARLDCTKEVRTEMPLSLTFGTGLIARVGLLPLC